MQVLIFNQRSIQEILEVIGNIGSLVGAHQSANTLIQGYIKGIEETQDRAAKRNHSPKVYFEEWDEPMISGIEWVSELIEIAGGQDIFSDMSKGKLARERFVTSEQVIAANPDVMLASWCGKAFKREEVVARDGWQAISAIKSGRIHEIAAAEILQPGPACLTAGLRALEQAIHPN